MKLESDFTEDQKKLRRTGGVYWGTRGEGVGNNVREQ